MDNRKLAYEKFKLNNLERLREIRRKASKKYYEKNKELIKEKRKNKK